MSRVQPFRRELLMSEDEVDALVAPPQTGPMALGGAYDAASRTSRELMLFSPPIRSADGDMLPAKALSDARALSVLGNDAYVAAGSTIHKNSIVGSMFALSAKPNVAVLGLDEVWATEFQEEVEAKFGLYAEAEENWMDAAGRNTFTGMVRLAVGVQLAGGEILATAEWIRDAGRPFQTAIQMVEANRLSDPADQQFDPERVRGGVEFNSYGAPIAYYIRRAMPGQIMDWRQQFNWSRILARKPRTGRRQVLHYVEQTRPGQTRGLSQIVAALKEMRITKRFRDITLQNAVVNASYAAAIESELPTEAVFSALGGGNVGDAVTDYMGQYLGAVAEYSGKANNMHLDGVRIPHLPPGSKLHMMPVGHPGGVGSDFEAGLLRYIAANLDVSYEQLSKDYSQTNYSSARAAMIETWTAMQAKKKMGADRFASAGFTLWLEEAFGRGEITALPRNAPNFYEGMNRAAYSACEWIGSARGQIDELKETQAAVIRLKRGLTTYEGELARQGQDWRQVFRQIARENALLEKLGITFEEVEAVNAASGEASSEGDAPRSPPAEK